MLKRESRIFMLTVILLCGIALQYMVGSIVLHDSLFVKCWKEVVITVLLIDILLPQLSGNNKERIQLGYSEIASLFFLVSLLGAAIFMTKNLYNSLFLARLYTIPILIYFVAKNSSTFTKPVVSKLVKLVLVFYSIIALWGIFQALILGDDFLIKLGYPLKYAGRLRDSYYFGGFGDLQRVVSTFANTNVFGAVIGVLILVVILNPTLTEKFRVRKYCLFILILAFILTFSRSNWLAMISIILVLKIKNKDKVILSLKDKKLYKNIALISVLCIFIIIIYNQIRHVNIFNVFQQYIINTITMKENSAAGRTGIWYKAFLTFINNPFGIGLGKVGMVSAKLSGKIYVVGESSYLAILLDTGIQGFLSYFAALILTFYSAIKHKSDNISVNNYLKTVTCIIIYLMIMFIFSNHIYDLEIMITMFFFIGLGQNKKFLDSFS